MNRRKFLQYLKENHCLLFREGKRHSVFYNHKTNRTSTVPRHNEIDDFLVNKICKDLGIDPMKK